MRYLLVKEVAKKWNISERSVRNYCTQGRVDEARLNGKTWEIPEDAQKPGRINRKKRSTENFAGNSTGRKEKQIFRWYLS